MKKKHLCTFGTPLVINDGSIRNWETLIPNEYVPLMEASQNNMYTFSSLQETSSPFPPPKEKPVRVCMNHTFKLGHGCT